MLRRGTVWAAANTPTAYSPLVGSLLPPHLVLEGPHCLLPLAQFPGGRSEYQDHSVDARVPRHHGSHTITAADAGTHSHTRSPFLLPPRAVELGGGGAESFRAHLRMQYVVAPLELRATPTSPGGVGLAAHVTIEHRTNEQKMRSAQCHCSIKQSMGRATANSFLGNAPRAHAHTRARTPARPHARTHERTHARTHARAALPACLDDALHLTCQHHRVPHDDLERLIRELVRLWRAARRRGRRAPTGCGTTHEGKNSAAHTLSTATKAVTLICASLTQNVPAHRQLRSLACRAAAGARHASCVLVATWAHEVATAREE